LALVTDAPELRVAGSGADRAALEALARELGIVDRVRLLGALMPEQVDEQMGRCLFYVCPSRNEGFGLSVLEAMAAGKAVIASRTGGVPEVVQENKTALLVPPGEPMALAKAMERLLIEPSIREQLAKAGKTRARQFNWQAISGQYCELYDHVSAGCRTRQVHPRERRY
jgi:glycosyltransferase involved in cell wall biosynthesis